MRLLDFGLAQMQEEETLTAAGDVPGTLAYIAPERLAGKEATSAADVWGVGVMLWEALAGPHPFWSGSLLETARAIGAGAPPLVRERPDLPKALLVAVDRALSLDPARRPSAERLARVLRGAFRERERKPRAELVRSSSRRCRPSRRSSPRGAGRRLERDGPPVLPGALGAAARRPRRRSDHVAATRRPRPRASRPDLPTRQLLARARTAVRRGRGCVAHPVLGRAARRTAPRARARSRRRWARSGSSRWRRSACARPFAAQPRPGPPCWSAALAAGLRGTPLPFTHALPPLGLGIAGSDNPVAVAGALWQALLAHPALGLEAAALAAAAALLPFARTRDLWGVAGAGAALLAATVLVPGVAVWPLVVTAWVTCVALAEGDPRRRHQHWAYRPADAGSS